MIKDRAIVIDYRCNLEVLALYLGAAYDCDIFDKTIKLGDYGSSSYSEGVVNVSFLLIKRK